MNVQSVGMEVNVISNEFQVSTAYQINSFMMQIMAQNLDLMTLIVPRQRNPPIKRFTGAAIAHVAKTVEDYYRPMFFMLIDAAVQQLRERFGDCRTDKIQIYWTDSTLWNCGW